MKNNISNESLKDISSRLDNRNIVIIDDDESILTRLKNELDREGYEISLFQSLEDFKKLNLDKLFVPLCIIDINFGDGKSHQGIEIAKSIKQVIPNSLCIAYSSDITFIQPGNMDNFDHILEKTNARHDSKIIIDLFDRHINSVISRYAQKAKLVVDQDKRKLQESQEIFKELQNKINESPFNSLNKKSYEELKLNPGWFRENSDYYVAFIDGNLFSYKSKNSSDLVKHINEYPEYKNSLKLIVKVMKVESVEKKTFRIPSSLCRVSKSKYK